MEVAIAATDSDEKNAIIALHAKRLGIARVIAIARDPDHVALLEDSGVTCISAPYATAAMVENFLDRPSVADLFEIDGGAASLVDVYVPENGRVVGLKIQDINIPNECVVAAIVRSGAFVVPRGGTEIMASDHVVFAGPPASVKDAHAVFVAKGEAK
jgi:Trk K+ transport system NAD-binding subunit